MTSGLELPREFFICILYLSDVIDWILNNLIEKNRTRRAVIKKLKEMSLIFKAPTRKSVHAGVPKNVWRYEEDIQLKELYETNRLNESK